METKSIMENHVRQRHLEMAFICRLCETGNIHYEPDLPSIKDHLKEDHSKDDLDNEDVKDYTRYPRLVQNFYTPTTYLELALEITIFSFKKNQEKYKGSSSYHLCVKYFSQFSFGPEMYTISAAVLKQ